MRLLSIAVLNWLTAWPALAETYCPQSGEAFVGHSMDGTRGVFEPQKGGGWLYTEYLNGNETVWWRGQLPDGLLVASIESSDRPSARISFPGDVDLAPPAEGRRTVSLKWTISTAEDDFATEDHGGEQILTIETLEPVTLGGCAFEAFEYLKQAYPATGPMTFSTEAGWYVPALGTRLSHVHHFTARSGAPGRRLRFFERFEPLVD